MIGPPPGHVRVYLACGVTDMRRGIDGLSSLAEGVIGARIANILTTIETAKMNGHNPETYLTAVLTRIKDTPSERLHELLAWNMPVAGYSLREMH